MINEFLYQVGEYRTYSKIDAFLAANRDWNRVHFNFMASTFANRDWSRPLESWQDLMRRRCQELRDRYSYLRLWFSGGWDSSTVLHTFIEHGIRLDELAIYDRQFFDGDSEVAPAIEYARMIQQQYMPQVKLSFIPIGVDHSEQIYDRYGSQWILTPGCSLMFPKTHRYFMEQELDAFAPVRSDSDRVGNIWAHDKPKVMLWDNKWYSFQVDASMIGHFKTDCELFFCTASMPELYIQQSHMAIDFFEALMLRDHRVDTELSHRIQSHQGQDYAMWNQALGRTHCIDNVSARHGLLKSTMGHFPMGEVSRRSYLHHRDTNSRHYHIYREGIKTVEELTGIAIPESGSRWIPNILSDRYFVRTLDPRLLKGKTA